ncbi:hypothetical protein AYO41_05315 [Verrucomicrobia bacterium SCGC AG-212-E04]|nr:hypothetical protein AYO41_05315 [Verrucomicrobia bacterium SCGC AG-212-E04]
MHYPFSLRALGLVLGLALVATHLLAALRSEPVKHFLRRFPRSHLAGLVLVTIDLIWAWAIAATMDWGEFLTWRMPVLVLLPVAYALTMFLVHEFLAARALGMLMLLAAMPLLDAAFMRPPPSRLLIVVLAYIWVVFGLWWTSSPHALRDHLDFAMATPVRWSIAVWSGIVYGLAMLAAALLWW